MDVVTEAMQMRKAVIGHDIRGFTLLEMLVVVLIMGILVGVVSAKLQPANRDVLRVEAERLAQLLELASQQARITGNTIAWTSDGSTYEFWRQGSDDAWSPIHDDNLLRVRHLPHGMVVSQVRSEVGTTQPTLRLEFAADGSMSAFSIDLMLANEHYAVAASPVGDLRTAPGQGKSYADMAAQ